jgi:hypothetical protein
MSLNRFMEKIICVNGDSFTQEFYQKPEDRWTTHIGATHNLAMGGSGNDRIFNTTIEYLNQQIPNTLIIGWSDPGRGTLSYNDGSRLIITPNRCFNEENGQDHKDVLEFYYKKIHNDYVAFSRTLNQMLFIQDYCRMKGIKLLYFRSVMGNGIDDQSLTKVAKTAYMSRADADIEKMGVKFNLEKLKSSINRLDRSIWIKEFWFSMRDYIWSNFDTSGYGGETPLPAEAVKAWGQIVARHL